MFFLPFYLVYCIAYNTFAPSNNKNDTTKTGTFPWWPLTPNKIRRGLLN